LLWNTAFRVEPLIETGCVRYMNGRRAALPYFRRQGHGTLVSVDSVLGTFDFQMHFAKIFEEEEFVCARCCRFDRYALLC
jgi:hypothetical protein